MESEKKIIKTMFILQAFNTSLFMDAKGNKLPTMNMEDPKQYFCKRYEKKEEAVEVGEKYEDYRVMELFIYDQGKPVYGKTVASKGGSLH